MPHPAPSSPPRCPARAGRAARGAGGCLSAAPCGAEPSAMYPGNPVKMCHQRQNAIVLLRLTTKGLSPLLTYLLPDRLVATRVRGRGRTGRLEGLLASLTSGGWPTAPGNRVARPGWDSKGGLNCLTHVLPRCLPTPTEEADGGGAGVLSPGGVASGPPSGAGDRPRTTAVDRRSTPSARADRQEPLPMFRCPGCRVP